MEAPNKIYLHPDIGGREFIRPWLHQAANSESVEYIRKEALLEWAKKEMKKWSSESNTAQGVKMGLTLVMDKIESL